MIRFRSTNRFGRSPLAFAQLLTPAIAHAIARVSRSELTSRCLTATAALATMLFISNARASVIVVTSNLDAIANDGVTSLREAVRLANQLVGPDTIYIPAGHYQFLRSGAGENNASLGDLDIRNADLTIIGVDGVEATTIDAGGLDRAFEVFSGVTLTLGGITVTHGAANRGAAVYLRQCARVNLGADGAPIVLEGNFASIAGGAVYSDRATILIAPGSSLSNNESLGDGGAIYVTGSCVGVNDAFRIDGARIDGNMAGDAGGGIAMLDVDVHITNGSVLEGNSALSTGGAVFNDGGSVHVSGASRLSSNSSQIGDGGAIAHLGNGSVTVTAQSELTDNSAGGRGGAISNADATNRGQVDISASKVNDNSGLDGGGIYNLGDLTIRSSQVNANGSSFDGGGILNDSQGTVVGVTSILDGSTVDINNCGGEGGAIINNGELTIGVGTSVSDNVSANGGAGIINNGVLHVMEATIIARNFSGDSGAGLLNNGTATFTGTSEYPIHIFSNFSSDSFGGLAGVTAGASLSLSHVVFDDNGSSDSGGSLVNDGGIVTVADCAFINNASNDSGAAIINRSGELSDGSEVAGVMSIARSRFFNNSADDLGGGVLNESEVTISHCEFDSNNGGAVGNSGTALVEFCEFRNNTSPLESGGAVANEGQMTLRDCLLVNNESGDLGGAIANSDGNLTLIRIILNDNRGLGGGAIAVTGGEVTVSQSTIENNHAELNGGAIIVEGGTIHLQDVQVSNNHTTTGDGGGLSVAIGGATCAQTRIEDNSVGGNGGGIAVAALAHFETRGGVSILRNSASFDGGGIEIGDATAVLDSTIQIETNSAGSSGGGIAISGNSTLVLGGALVGYQIRLNMPDDLENEGATVMP